MDDHQFKVEEIFKLFYDTLDTIRNDMLSQEYQFRNKMDNFENETKRLVQSLSTYSLLEFFHEEEQLKEKIDKLRRGLDQFNIYLPKTQVLMQDVDHAKNAIVVDLRERINSYIGKVDHNFALANYDHVMNTIVDEKCKDIYR